MWNFLVGGLSIGCTLVLYDGSPLRDASLLWKLVDELGITIFGTSAKYLDQLSVSTPFRGIVQPTIYWRIGRNNIDPENTITSVPFDISIQQDLLWLLLFSIMYTNISILMFF